VTENAFVAKLFDQYKLKTVRGTDDLTFYLPSKQREGLNIAAKMQVGRV